MIQTAIEALLRQKIGLEIETIGSKKIAKAIEIRCKACGVLNPHIYLKRLQASDRELLALVENIVVPETSFFRHKESFSFLEHYLKTEWLSRHKQRILRVLSLACSTGEEPYSIAITLTESGLSPKNFHLNAIDISEKALLRASQAVYGNHSFRGNDWPKLKDYFQQTDNGYQLCQSIRSSVNFQQGNFLDPFLWRHKQYHIIFCRNVLIYLDATARSHTMNVLDRLLSDRGLLFVGAAETGLFKNPQWVSIYHPYAFAYQKVRSREQGDKKTKRQEENFQPSTCNLQVRVGLPRTYPSTPLETARNLANQGQLEQAANLCLRYVSQYPTHAQTYLLLGEIYQAQGNNECAEQYFQKATYLDPDCDNALTYLALLREYRGDLSGAGVIRQRIQRLHRLKVEKP